jgi:hypothetical protein
MTLLSIGMAGLQYFEGQSRASAAAEASNRSTELGYQQENERLKQVNEQSALDKSERVKQGMLERAKMSTIAGESGALGLSSDRLLNDSFMQEGTDIASLEKNRINAQTQGGYAKQQAQANGQSANNAAYSNAPSLLGTGLQIGGDIYTGMQKAKDKAKAKV